MIIVAILVREGIDRTHEELIQKIIYKKTYQYMSIPMSSVSTSN